MKKKKSNHAAWVAGPAAAVLLFCAGPLFAGLPPSLPGDELSAEQFEAAQHKDTAAPAAASVRPAPSWLDKAQKTWEAPPIPEQMAAGAANIPFAKGGIFVPRFTAANSEPEVTVRDGSGRVIASGNPGSTFAVEPGAYSVRFGSGAHGQRLVRTVTVEEGKTAIVTPDWSGLSIETLDSMATPFRGEYELVRIDEFETYGRAFGANPELGEVVKTWILQPGVYKILGIGQGYHSITNFVTARLLPGELCRVMLVQDTATHRILGGGTVDVRPQSKITSHWKYGANVGGNVNFNSRVDRVTEDTTVSTLFGILSTLWLTFQDHPYEWQTRIRLNEGFNFSGWKFMDLATDADDFLVNSLLIWRILPWLGPYGSAEVRTTLLPSRMNRDVSHKYFCRLNRDSTLAGPPACFDSSTSFQNKPSLSPILFDIGIGANADVLSFSFLEMKIRAGFGSRYTHFPVQYLTIDTSAALWRKNPDTIWREQMKSSILLIPQEATSDFESGPQTSLSGMVRIGRLATAEAELKIFAPVTPEERVMRPDFDLFANISWRLFTGISLDYTYTFQLSQPEKQGTRVDRSSHGIWLRFSYSSR